MIVNIYIPNDNKELGIEKGSAIVGVPVEGNLVKAYFEGNLYGAHNLHHYKERVTVAALRLRDKCPTVAMSVIPTKVLTFVGQYNIETQAYFVKEKDLLAKWEASYKHSEGQKI